MCTVFSVMDKLKWKQNKVSFKRECNEIDTWAAQIRDKQQQQKSPNKQTNKTPQESRTQHKDGHVWAFPYE